MSINLGYNGYTVHILVQDDNLEALGILMAYYYSNPNTLNYYDFNGNFILNTISNAIIIANFYTVIPQNNISKNSNIELVQEIWEEVILIVDKI